MSGHTQFDVLGEAIAELIENRGYTAGDIAVLYRNAANNKDATSLRADLKSRGIPLREIGVSKFVERKEVADMLAYLRLIVFPNDEMSFKRVVNVPPRQIGPKTIDSVYKAATLYNQSAMDALRLACKPRGALPAGVKKGTRGVRITKKNRANAAHFLDTLDELRGAAESEEVSRSSFAPYFRGLVDTIMSSFKYDAYLRKMKGEERELAENPLLATGMETLDQAKEAKLPYRHFIDMLCAFADDFQVDDDGAFSESEDETLDARTALQRFLAYIVLRGDDDDKKRYSDGGVVLSTIHRAKGLEWPVVFLLEFRQNRLPFFPNQTGKRLQEERRLAHVAMTRPKDLLVLVYTTKLHRACTLQLHPRSGQISPVRSPPGNRSSATLALAGRFPKISTTSRLVPHPAFHPPTFHPRWR